MRSGGHILSRCAGRARSRALNIPLPPCDPVSDRGSARQGPRASAATSLPADALDPAFAPRAATSSLNGRPRGARRRRRAPGRGAGADRRAARGPDRAADAARLANARPFRPGRLSRRQDRRRRDARWRRRCARRRRRSASTPRFIEPLGWLDPYLTGTGFRIAPLVALVDPAFTLTINAARGRGRVRDAADFLMDERQPSAPRARMAGPAAPLLRDAAIEERYIWGATAGMLRNLWERLYSLMVRARARDVRRCSCALSSLFAIFLVLRARFPAGGRALDARPRFDC